jgi:hypothetical protein
MKMHESLTKERILEAAQRTKVTELDNPGFCIYCGEEAEGCEPDARRYRCEVCGKHGVYAAEELLIMVAT